MTLWKWLILFGIVKPRAYQWVASRHRNAHGGYGENS